MTEKELRRLRRLDLIEIIYKYQRRERKLQEENETLRAQLDSKVLKLKEAGSIAKAALELNGVFEAAQRAADQYLVSVKAASGGGAKKGKKSKKFRRN